MQPIEEASGVVLSEWQQGLINAIKTDDIEALKKLLPRAKFNYVDENGMTPLQHASYKGNKEAVQIMLDLGADVDFSKHGAKYTALHFGALSGNTEVCRMLLDAGIDPHAVNSISRTAAQLAAFVGNHACVETINNYVDEEVLEYYTQRHGQQTAPLIPPAMLKGFHRFVIAVNLHPVRVVLNIVEYGLIKNLQGLKRSLELMCDKEMKKAQNVNELLALKFHYLGWIVTELMRTQEQRKESTSTATITKDESSASGSTNEKNHDFIELFIKRILKENKQGELEYMEYVVREALRSFPFWECTIFRQVAHQLAADGAPPALTVLRHAINGHRSYVYETTNCSTCGKEKPDKKCSKCKIVQYCDRECQRLHWSMHKKSCARPSSQPAVAAATSARTPIDTNELSEQLTKLKGA